MDADVDHRPSARAAAVALAAVLCFAAAASGGRDLWAATPIYLAVLALATAVFVGRTWPEDAPGYRLAPPLPLAALVLALAISCRGAVNPEESLGALLDWLAAVAAYLTAVNVFSDDRALDDFLACSSLILIAELAVGIAQKFHRWTAYPLPWLHLVAFQPAGTFGNSNTSTAFVLPWLTALAAKRRTAAGRARSAWTLALACGCGALLIFVSHWAMLCAAATLPFLAGPRALRRWSPQRKRRTAAAAAVLAAVFAAVLWHKFTRTIDIDNNPIPQGRSISRLLWWASALKMFRDHPLSGVGLGNYASAYVSYKVGFGQHSLFAHSLPLELLAETGLLGLLAFAFFVAAWLRRAAGGSSDPPARWPFALGAVLLLAYSLMSVGLEYLANLLVLWLFFGAVAAKSAPVLWKPRRSVVLVLATLAFAAGPSLLAPLVASRAVVEGEARLSGGDYARAVDRFASAQQAFPLSFEAQRGWARALYLRYLAGRDAADLEGAIEHQTKAIALDRREAGLWSELALYRQARSDDAGAREARATAAALHPNPSLY